MCGFVKTRSMIPRVVRRRKGASPRTPYGNCREYECVRSVLGSNFGLPVEKTVGLVEIDGFIHVGRNQPVVLPPFRDAVHLDSEEHGDILPVEFAREFDRFRAAPAHPIDDDACIPLFFLG